MTGSTARRVPRFVFLVATANHADGTRAGWRLVAANNRPLARGARADASLADSRASALLVHRNAGAATRSAWFDPSAGMWTWSAHFDDVRLAVCAHPYLRRTECYRAMQHFIAAALQADPEDGVVRYFGPQTLREYADVTR